MLETETASLQQPSQSANSSAFSTNTTIITTLNSTRFTPPPKASVYSSSTGLGDYIASGLGLSTLTAETTSSVSTFTSEPVASNASISGSSLPVVTAHSTNASSSMRYGNASIVSISATGLQHYNGTTNASLSQCWDQWSSYWSAESTPCVTISLSKTTSSDIGTYTVSWSSTPAETVTFSARTETYAPMDGPFTLPTTTQTIPASTNVQAGVPATDYTTIDTEIFTSWLTSMHCHDTKTLVKPTCALPSIVPQCQSSWDAYVSYQVTEMSPSSPTCSATAPACQSAISSFNAKYGNDGWWLYSTPLPDCTLASIDASQCGIMQESYVSRYGPASPTQQYNGVSGGFTMAPVTTLASQTITVAGVRTVANSTVESYIWPTHLSLAPGCSLGCARCAVTGGTVQMIYWPATVTPTASDHPITATALNTTFTYPTVRIT